MDRDRTLRRQSGPCRRSGQTRLAVNVYSESEARLDISGAGKVVLAVKTGYPRSEDVRITVTPARKAAFPLFVRIPAWAQGTHVQVNGPPAAPEAVPGSYLRLQRTWRSGDVVSAS